MLPSFGFLSEDLPRVGGLRFLSRVSASALPCQSMPHSQGSRDRVSLISVLAKSPLLAVTMEFDAPLPLHNGLTHGVTYGCMSCNSSAALPDCLAANSPFTDFQSGATNQAVLVTAWASSERQRLSLCLKGSLRHCSDCSKDVDYEVYFTTALMFSAISDITLFSSRLASFTYRSGINAIYLHHTTAGVAINKL